MISWTDAAACAGLPTNLMYPQEKANGAEYVSMAKICRTCPVRVECSIAGLAEDHGIWGGWSPRQRAVFRSRLRMNELVGYITNEGDRFAKYHTFLAPILKHTFAIDVIEAFVSNMTETEAAADFIAASLPEFEVATA